AAALGCAYALAGRLTEALPLLEEVEQKEGAKEATGGHALQLGYLGEAYLLAGHTQKAVQVAERAVDLSRAHKERGYEAWAVRLLGEIAARQDAPQIALTVNHYQRACTLAEELGMRPLVAHCHLGLGKPYRRTGQSEQAHEHLTRATTMYREMGMTYWLQKPEAKPSNASAF